jgi:translocator protein
MTSISAKPAQSGSARWWGLAAFVAAVILTAAIGSLAALHAAADYKALAKPAWAPPSWLFGPVWTILYAMIAYAGWRAWLRGGLGVPIWAYGFQLALNAAWTPVFFAGRDYGLAVIIIVALWIAIASTVWLFARRDRMAAWLLVPYWMWVTFAAALNVAVWKLNQ